MTDKIKKHSTEIITITALIALIGAGVTASTTNILNAGTSNEDSLVAEYRFDTGTGNTVYDSVGKNDGVISGAGWSSGVKGSSLNLKSNGDQVSVDDHSTLDGQENGITVSFWFYSRQDNVGGWSEVLSKGSFSDAPYAMIVDNIQADTFRFQPTLGDQSGNYYRAKIESIPHRKWTHLAMRYDPETGEMNLFKNGKIEATESVGNIDLATNSNNLQFGEGGGGDYIDGKVDNAKIYNTPLNNSQLKSIYNQGSWRIGTATEQKDQDKVLDMSFQHQNSSHVFDTSGYNNHGERLNDVSQESAVGCKVGRCYSFDGNDDALNLEDTVVIKREGSTVSWWMKPSQTSSTNLFNSGVGGYDNYISVRSNTLTAETRTNCNGFYFNQFTKSNNWNHYSIVLENSKAYLYENGKFLGEATSYRKESCNGDKATQLLDNININYIGTETSYNSYYSGKIDQVKIFNRSLSQSEIIEKTQGLDSDGAVLDMRFDSGGGDHVEDYSGEENHGSLNPNETSGPDRVEGLMGEALKFDGTDDQVSISGDSSLHMSDGTWTQVLWAKGEHEGSNMNALRLSGGWQTLMEVPSQDTWQAGFYDGSGWNWVRSDADTSKLHQVVFVGREDEIELWIDGEEVDSLSTLNSPPSSRDGGSGYLGSVGGSRYYNGVIERARVFQQPLSSSEIKQLYAIGKSHVGSSKSSSSTNLQDDLVLSQTFNRIENCGQSDTVSCPSGMSGEVAVDESGEANHGELVNGPEVKDAEDCRVSGCLGLEENENIYASDSESLKLTDNITVSTWFRTNSSDMTGSCCSSHNFVNKYDAGSGTGFMLGVAYEDTLYTSFYKNGTGYDSRKIPEDNPIDGEWHQLTAVKEGDRLKMYYDGRLIESSTSEVGNFSNDVGVTLGKGYGGNQDETKIFDKTLSEEGVWKLYTRGRDRSSDGELPGPVAHYPIKREASPLTDVSGEGNHGNLNLLGESGMFNTSDGEWKTIRFDRSYADPVVIGTTNTQNGEPALSFEARNVDSGSAEMRVCESEGENAEGCDTHGTERVGYVVINAKATEDIPDIEAGTFEIDSEIDSKVDTISYSESFSNAPYVMANVNSDNGNNPVEARVTDYSASDFTAGICYQNSNEGCEVDHPYEEVGWVALEPGNLPFEQVSEIGSTGNSVSGSSWTPQSFSNTYSRPPVLIASTVSNDGGDELEIDEVRNVDSDGAEVRYCEQEGSNGCEGHTSEEVAWFAAPEGLLTYTEGNFPRYVDTEERGKALNFDGSDDYVEVLHKSSLEVSNTEELTITGWVRLRDTSKDTWERLLEKGSYSSGGYSLQRDNPSSNPSADKRLRFYFADSNGWGHAIDVVQTSANSLNKWHHFTVTAQNGKVTTYFDGRQTNQDTGWQYTSTTDSLDIGSRDGGASALTGSLDDVRIYPYALSQEQVKKVMNGGAVSVG